MEIQKSNLNLPDAVVRKIRELQLFQITLQEMKNQETEIKEAILKAMEESGVKSAEIDGVAKITYVAPSVRKTLDKGTVEAFLKDMGENLSDYYKATPVSASVRITYAD